MNKNNEPAFYYINYSKKKEDIKENTATMEDLNEIREELSIFAKEMPEWSIEPPQIMIRRKKK